MRRMDCPCGRTSKNRHFSKKAWSFILLRNFVIVFLEAYIGGKSSAGRIWKNGSISIFSFGRIHPWIFAFSLERSRISGNVEYTFPARVTFPNPEPRRIVASKRENIMSGSSAFCSESITIRITLGSSSFGRKDDFIPSMSLSRGSFGATSGTWEGVGRGVFGRWDEPDWEGLLSLAIGCCFFCGTCSNFSAFGLWLGDFLSPKVISWLSPKIWFMGKWGKKDNNEQVCSHKKEILKRNQLLIKMFKRVYPQYWRELLTTLYLWIRFKNTELWAVKNVSLFAMSIYISGENTNIFAKK